MDNSLPNLFIAGVAKCGTTALHAYLALHPLVFTAEIKEPRFLSHEGSASARSDPANPRTITSLAEYRRLYRSGVSHAYRIDASNYLADSAAISRLAELAPDARILLLLRDPVERAFSHFVYALQKGFEPPYAKFHDAVNDGRISLSNGHTRHRKYFQMGQYDVQLDHLFDHVHTDRVHIVVAERFRQHPIAVLNEVFRFLELDPAPIRIDRREHAKSGLPRYPRLFRILNALEIAGHGLPIPARVKALPKAMIRGIKTKTLEKPVMNATLREHLVERYLPHVRRARAEFGIDTSWWPNFAD